MLKFTKVNRGWYATEDGKYAVVRDITGYVTQDERDSDGVMAGCDDDGWAAIYDAAGRLRENSNDGINLDWCDTKRQAVERLEQHARNSV